MSGMDVEDFVSVAEAVEISGYDRMHIALLCRQGRLPGARKMGSQWIIPRKALQEYMPAPPGPRPGSKRVKEDPLEAELKEAIARGKARKERGDGG